MNYEKNYITLTQYKQHKMAGSRYIGFVIGYGYVFQMYKILMPPNQHGYNCSVPNLHPDDSHCIPLMEYVEIRNLETIRLSVKGLFTNGIATYIVQKGDTLSHIALWFEVSIADILAWNPKITNANRIIDEQKIIIKEKRGELPKPDMAKRPSDIENIVKQPNEKLLNVPKNTEPPLLKYAGNQSKYPGAIIMETPLMPYKSGVTLPPFIFTSPSMGNDKDLMRHEHGHLIQYAVLSFVSGGPISGYVLYLVSVGGPSIISADKQNNDPTHLHREFYTEKLANQLSYWFQGMPADWNDGKFPLYFK